MSRIEGWQQAVSQEMKRFLVSRTVALFKRHAFASVHEQGHRAGGSRWRLTSDPNRPSNQECQERQSGSAKSSRHKDLSNGQSFAWLSPASKCKNESRGNQQQPALREL